MNKLMKVSPRERPYVRAREHDMWSWALVTFEMFNGVEWPSSHGDFAAPVYVLIHVYVSISHSMLSRTYQT